MNIIQKICTKSDCYATGRRIKVRGLMLHSVGCNQPDANVFANTWNKAGWNVCTHAVIGINGLVIQTLPWDWRGWHGGGSSNDTHIGVEMTEPSTIRYTSGANWVETGNGSNTKRHVLDTYNTAVELFAMLCRRYGLDPLGDGVIVSHSEGYKRGIATGHADVEHIWRFYGLTMNQFRSDVAKRMESDGVSDNGDTPTPEDKDDNDNPDIDTSNFTKIAGDSLLTEYQLTEYARDRGVSDDYLKLIPIYIGVGRKEGIRGDIAFCQSLVETGNFKFGGDVSANQNNFAGLGATGNGERGNVFSSPEEGITAQIQHLKAYANEEPVNTPLVDTRFKYVERGVSPYVEWLGIQENPRHRGWAGAKGYGDAILRVMKSASSYKNQEIQSEPKSPEGLYVVRLRYDDTKSQIGVFKNLDYAKKLVDTRPEYKVFDDKGVVIYEVSHNSNTKPDKHDKPDKNDKVVSVDKIVAPYIVRVGANTDIYISPTKRSTITQTIREVGRYTIVAENNGFGKLKSGVGYIDLSEVDKEKVFRPYTVKVTVPNLNIRREPNGTIVGQIKDRGVYTIVEERSNWGRLKSGAGWVCLDFTETVDLD